jgi:hypothetical protein
MQSAVDHLDLTILCRILSILVEIVTQALLAAADKGNVFFFFFLCNNQLLDSDKPGYLRTYQLILQ